MDWTIAGAIAGSLLTLAAGWAWGTAYGYRKGMQGRPTLIDPISKFLKQQDRKRVRAAEADMKERFEELMNERPAVLMSRHEAQALQANRPGRDTADPDPFGIIKPKRKVRADAGIKRGPRPKAKPKRQGRAGKAAKPKGRPQAARTPKRPVRTRLTARKGKPRRPRG